MGYVPFMKSEPFKNTDQLYVLVLGCDENRYYVPPGSNRKPQIIDKYARTDTIQLIRLDFKRKSIGMMQIPRDTVVEVNGYARQKINGLHTLGGKDATAEAVTQLTGIRPDRVVVLDYDAIRKIIDEVGGVEVYVSKRMKYDDKRGELHVDLKPGRQLLDSDTAIGFLRFRHDSDFERGKRQQEFMVAFKQRVTEEVAWNQVPRLASLAMKVVGGGISADEFIAIGMFAKEIPPAAIKHGIYPVEEGAGTRLNPIYSKVQDALIESGLIDGPPRTIASASPR